MRRTMRATCSSAAVCLLWAIASGLPAAAQTRVNLQYQSQGADFGSLAGTRPFSTGTVLPPVCRVGEVYFKTDAEPGANVFVCSATNVWTSIRGNQADATSGIAEFRATRMSNTVLTIGACSEAVPCSYGFSQAVTQITEAARVTLNSGSGTLLVYLDRWIGLVAAPTSGLNVACYGCTVISGITTFPADSIPQFRWTASSGVWEQTGTDLRALLRREVFVAGDNITLTNNGDAVVISSTASASGGTGGSGGNVSSAEVTSVDGELAVFSGVTGKAIKRSTGTGFLRANAGVLGTTASISASDISTADKQGTGAKLASSGSVTSGNCAEWDANGSLISAATPCAKPVTAGSNVTVTTVGNNLVVAAATQGNVSSSETASVDGEIAVFSGTAGKTIKRSNSTGFVKSTAGVLSTTPSIAASNISSTDKQGTGSKLVTSGTIAASNCAEWDANGILVSTTAPCAKPVVAGSNVTVTTVGNNLVVAAATQGNVSSSETTSVDGELAVFSGNGGKAIKRSTATGFIKATSGLLSTATSIAAADISVGDKQGDGTKIATAGTIVPNRCAEWDANGKLISSSGACGGSGGNGGSSGKMGFEVPIWAAASSSSGTPYLAGPWWIPVGGPVPTSQQSGVWKYGYLPFLKTASESVANFSISIPSDWDGLAPSLRLEWFPNSSASGTGRLNVATTCIGVGQAAFNSLGPTFNAIQSLDYTLVPPSDGRLVPVTLSGLTTTGCSAGQIMILRISRPNSADPADTISGALNLVRGHVRFLVTLQ